MADEKMSWARGEKLYLPTIVAAGCFLGAAVVTTADADHLTTGYQEFAAEARQLEATYRPTTVCTDGFPAIRKAWRQLFPTVSLVFFLHSFIKLRDRCCHQVRTAVLERACHIYEADTKRSFARRARRSGEWAVKHLTSPPLSEVVERVRDRVAEYLTAYDHLAARRTSNMVDRLMNYQDRKLYAMRYFHHSTGSARLTVRAMASLWKFHPHGERLRHSDKARASLFCDLNGYQYHQNLPYNFLIASSMGGLKL